MKQITWAFVFLSCGLTLAVIGWASSVALSGLGQ